METIPANKWVLEDPNKIGEPQLIRMHERSLSTFHYGKPLLHIPARTVISLQSFQHPYSGSLVSLSPVIFALSLIVVIGHESIINSTAMHPHLPFIATAGIERHVLLHSPTATTPCTDELTHTPTAVRELPEANFNDRRRMLRALIAEQADNELDQDRDTIALFDE